MERWRGGGQRGGRPKSLTAESISIVPSISALAKRDTPDRIIPFLLRFTFFYLLLLLLLFFPF